MGFAFQCLVSNCQLDWRSVAHCNFDWRVFFPVVLVGLITSGLTLLASVALIVFSYWKHVKDTEIQLPLFLVSVQALVMTAFWACYNALISIGNISEHASTAVLQRVTFFMEKLSVLITPILLLALLAPWVAALHRKKRKLVHIIFFVAAVLLVVIFVPFLVILYLNAFSSPVASVDAVVIGFYAFFFSIVLVISAVMLVYAWRIVRKSWKTVKTVNTSVALLDEPLENIGKSEKVQETEGCCH